MARSKHVKWLLAVVWLGALLLAVFAWTVVLELSNRDREEALARAERDSGNLAHIIAEQAARAISDTDRILDFLAYDIGRLGPDHPKLGDVLKNAIRGSDLLVQLGYSDASGAVIESSGDGPVAKVSLADREHFLVHKLGKLQGLFISQPVFGRVSGKWSLQLSRRISAPDGSFAGVMVASLDPFYFSRTFAVLDIGQHGVVTMFGRDGILRARSALGDSVIGRDVSTSSTYRTALTVPNGFRIDTSPVDGVRRLVSFRTVAGYPLIVVAGFDEAEFLANTLALRTVYVAGASAATAMLLILALLVTWQARVQDRARALAEHGNRMKSQFLATISHEIRTPMTGVLGMLALLENDETVPLQQQRAATARRSAEGLLGLLDDILDFSRLEADKCFLTLQNCQPAQTAAAVVDLLRLKAEEKGLALSVHVGPAVPEIVLTDPMRLRQILFNLVGNAVKFTASGCVIVRIQRGADLSDGRFMLEFEVEDTGIGISAETIATLFHNFTQADGSITRRYGGSGLGLAICKRLCRLLGGDVTVSSILGRGSVFRFTIVAGQSDAAAPDEAPAEDASAALPRLQPLRLLVVDDNAVNLEVVAGLLESAGHRVVTADSGSAAIATLRASEAGRFDAVLMDVQMPEMDGLSATRQIRALPAPLDAVPVIALTAHASNSSRNSCRAAGMNGFTTKPIRLRPLLIELAFVLAARASQPGAPETLLDTAQVDELTGRLKPEAWSRIIDSFVRSAEVEIGRILAAIDHQQTPADAAHALKGLALNAGARHLGTLARQLETAASDEARRIAGDMPAVLHRSVAALLAIAP